MATKGFVLLTCEPSKTKNVLKTLSKKDFVQSVNCVTGRFDAVLQIKADSVKGISDTVLSNIRSIDGVRRTETLINAE